MKGHAWQRHGKRVALTVVDSNSPRWMPDGKMPASREECPDTSVTMCGAIWCRWHLLRVDGGPDGDRSGRPSLGRATRGERGWTASQPGDLGDERPGATLDPLWLDENGEFRHVETCALDVVRRHGAPMTNEQTGVMIGRHRTLAARIVKSALARYIEVSAEQGIDEASALRGIRMLATPEDAAEDMRDEPKRGRKG